MSMIRTEHLAKSFGELVVLKDINLSSYYRSVRSR